jgi:aspartyl-tRNA(Asn)/glutamyl-tRNA(Gln) amidotransferase subunit A
MRAITRATITKLVAAYWKGDLSPVEAVEAYLKRIGREQKRLNAFISVADEDALLAKARAAEEEYGRGDVRRSLLGVPIAVKDNVMTRGLKTTGGSKSRRTPAANRDAHSVALLRAAGAIIIGKTNVGFGPGAANSHFGAIRNPWDLARSPGASSSGSAAAVAAGLAAASVGTDTGGSIRVPSAFCGVVGMKPSRWLVSTDGIVSTVSCPSLDHVGPVTRSVEDAFILLSAMGGLEGKNAPKFLRGGSIKGSRIGIPKDAMSWPLDLDRGVQRNFLDSVAVLRSLGASVSQVELPRVDELRESYGIIAGAERASIYASERASSHPGGEAYVSRAKRGLSISASSYLRAKQKRKELSAVYDRVFQSLDVLITPTVPCIAMRSDEVDAQGAGTGDITVYTSPFNLTGQPAVTLPNGFSHGLPTGLQLAGRFGRDQELLEIAVGYESATTWHKEHPRS